MVTRKKLNMKKPIHKVRHNWCSNCGKYKKMPTRYGILCWDCLPKHIKKKIKTYEKSRKIIYKK